MSHHKKNDPLSDESLNVAQQENLNFVEYITNKSLKICDVPVMNALVYDFIQILNNMYLQTILKDIEPEEEKELVE